MKELAFTCGSAASSALPSPPPGGVSARCPFAAVGEAPAPAPGVHGQRLLAPSLLPGLLGALDASFLWHQGAKAEPVSAPRRPTAF